MTREAKIVIVLAVLYLLWLFYRRITRRDVKHRVRELSRNAVEMSPEAFFRLRSESEDGGRAYTSARYDYAGVYILYNKTKNMYYVGQAQAVLSRINQHLTGHGNGDVYADYKFGDKFSITSVRLKGSGFKTLNELERHAISIYDAYSKGYNKTRGNRG
ncbi:MAG: GIY-YIG nuclease family protein [Oscillospiraceae bacterium]|nr:GIY-YIG nuclease family protein [Oscillospiraceae bacterium]